MHARSALDISCLQDSAICPCLTPHLSHLQKQQAAEGDQEEFKEVPSPQHRPFGPFYRILVDLCTSPPCLLWWLQTMIIQSAGCSHPVPACTQDQLVQTRRAVCDGDRICRSFVTTPDDAQNASCLLCLHCEINEAFSSDPASSRKSPFSLLLHS